MNDFGFDIDPTLRGQPAQPQAMQQEEQGGSNILDFFRSMFHRQSDIDEAAKGLRQPAQPMTGGIRG